MPEPMTGRARTARGRPIRRYCGPPRRRAGLVALAVFLPALVVTSADAAPSVRIVSPRPIEIVNGVTTIEAAVSDLPGAVVEFFVDGVAAGSVSVPPYRVEFDFGDSLRSRRIRVVATGRDGTRLGVEVGTRSFDPGRVDQVARVDLVNLFVTVRDRSGKLVQGLDRADFTVYEAGRSQEISHFSRERLGLVVALVLDSSLSMAQEGKMEAAREAAAKFLDNLQPEDRALVICFNQDVALRQELTTDRKALSGAIAECSPQGGTALYDAIYRAADRLAPLEGRKVVVLLSDGRDEAANGLEPGSLHTLEEAIDRTLRSEVILFGVGVGRHLDREMDFYGRQSLQSILEKLSESTGGRPLILRRSAQLRDAFDEIQEELRYQYSLAYVPADTRRDGGWRELRVTVNRPGLKAYTRKGYFAAP